MAHSSAGRIVTLRIARRAITTRGQRSYNQDGVVGGADPEEVSGLWPVQHGATPDAL